MIYPGIHGSQNHVHSLGWFMEEDGKSEKTLVYTNKTVGTKSELHGGQSIFHFQKRTLA